MAVRGTNPLILLQGRTPGIQPAINTFFNARQSGNQNRLSKLQIADDTRQLGISTLTQAAKLFVPQIESGDIAGARATIKRARRVAEASGVPGLTDDFDDMLNNIGTKTESVARFGRQILQAFPQTGQSQGKRQIVKTGVPGKPEFVQNSILLDDDTLKNIGEPFKRSTGTTVNVGTKGQTEFDKVFAKEAAEFMALGGFADVEKSLDQLKNVSKALESGRELTGPVVGNVPDFVNQFINPEAIDVREQVEEVAQRNLRVILGGQFSEKEGENLIKRAFNPRLGQKENKRRVDRLIKQISDAALAKQESIKYFQLNGTLKGFTGKIYTKADFTPEVVYGTDEKDSQNQIGRFKIEVIE